MASLKDQVSGAVDTAKSYGRKAINVAENLTGVREVRKIRDDLKDATNQATSQYHGAMRYHPDSE